MTEPGLEREAHGGTNRSQLPGNGGVTKSVEGELDNGY